MEELFLKKLAEAYQNYDASIIEDYLADDMHYASFWVFQELTSKEEYLDYLKGKLQTMKNSGTTFEFQIVNGRHHSKALFVHKVNGQLDDQGGFVADFNEEGKVTMLNMTIPSFL